MLDTFRTCPVDSSKAPITSVRQVLDALPDKCAAQAHQSKGRAVFLVGVQLRKYGLTRFRDECRREPPDA
jgi:hypothetical protein